MPSGLEQLLLSNIVTGAVTVVGTVTALRGKRIELAGDVRVAKLESEATFAGELRAALADIGRLQASLGEERGRVMLLGYQLTAVTAEKDELLGEVEQLRHKLEDSAGRLDVLNGQLTALSSTVSGLIPRTGTSS
jgi:chromosome segregation ATPase